MVFTTLPKIENFKENDRPLVPLPFVSLQNITWQTYQSLKSDLGEHRSVKLTYDRGTLEIKMPSKLHELINRLLERLITTLTEELDLNIVSLGSTTFDQEAKTQGIEPDSCFYIQNADRIHPEDDRPPQDCPPDLVVEVDITSSSRSRFPIYQSMGVPEIWCYKHQDVTIFRLKQDGYQTCEYSEIFPFLSVVVLRQFVQQGQRSTNQNALIKEFRTWIQQKKSQNSIGV
jgi:Uma2 family endonuclease